MTNLKPVVGLDDAFGVRAKALRTLQTKLFTLYETSGYEEVIPPIVERPESLSSGAGHFLSDQTLVFSDPADAGLLAIRPDITPQVARIASTRLRSQNVLKLCYSGPVLLARPDPRTGSRQQWQTGLECLGMPGEEGDIEAMHLAALSMREAGFDAPVLQVGHMGLLQALVQGSATPMERWTTLLSRRSPEDMRLQLESETLDEARKTALMEMAEGHADRSWLESKRDHLGGTFAASAGELIHLTDTVARRLENEVAVQIDVAVMPRFLYHTGILFAGFAQGAAQALIYGGRYDAMMASHGRDMAATGFSLDLWAWLDARHG